MKSQNVISPFLFFPFLSVSILFSPVFCLRAEGPAAPEGPKALWQESAFFDALMEARDKESRAESDPEMIPVLKAIAAQVAQQVANLSRVDAYAKAQTDNLGFAFEKAQPQKDVSVIGANFQTLSQGADQIRGNLDYLAVRCRMARSQALPDKEMYQAAVLVLRQVQRLQLALNSLYRNAVAGEAVLVSRRAQVDPYAFAQYKMFKRSVVHLQPAVYSVYNSGYALAQNCR